ncbi:hypothetical protein G7Z17_g1481 [Cylindrodendrum hubeiense]|uniref:non-specific serine/threonine protein kinase n=1 Tax=Cylindrodendrum hubeiense TaxID=595255 RepID=A0A9P5LLC9_9HYPO|nr:hypothetical protein G7Z17_g1481 [Cylindrodendrum hubeiense]
MDHYRLLSPISRDCESRHHTHKIIECAYPPIPVTAEKLFEEVESRGDKTFYSQRQLKAHFGKEETIWRLLRCGCDQCKTQRGDPLDVQRYYRYIFEKHAWLLLPIMVYLGKLHFIYPWLDTMEMPKNNSKTHTPVQCSNVEPLRRLLPHDLERTLFISAYERAVKMFSPFVFQIDHSGTVPPKPLIFYERFPFQEERKRTRQGQFGTLLYFEIPDEYVDGSVASRMEAYPKSITGRGNAKKYRFARKVLKFNPQGGMEKEMLQLVSRIKGRASENIITLLALYYWRESVHYVFPFVESSLYSVLREGHFQDQSPHSLLRLPDHWLWDQMVGVARALSAIHTGIDNPFSENEGKVIAFHFDLKPDNILVTADRKLKITDFGQSVIELVNDDEERSTSFMPGDIKYNAPESRLDKDARRSSSDEPRNIQVLLNYDVWSLACIMVEVLIFILADPSQRGTEKNELQAFDEELNAEKPEVVFFGVNDVKTCVSQKVDSIAERFINRHPSDEVHEEYISSVRELIHEMFRHNKALRPQSERVKECLEDAAETYLLACQLRGDRLRTRIKRKELEMEGISGFREIGWCKDDTVVSFLEMNEVSVKVQRIDQTAVDLPESCRIQLLYKPEEVKRRVIKPAQFILKWGFEKQGKEPTVRECIIDTAYAQFIPTYLYKEEAEDEEGLERGEEPENEEKKEDEPEIEEKNEEKKKPANEYKCTLFDGVTGIGSDIDLILTLGFKSRRDVENFQGALLHHKVIPNFGQTILAQKVTWTERSTSRLRRGNTWTTVRTQIQFWTEEKLNYCSDLESQSTESVTDILRRPSFASTYSAYSTNIPSNASSSAKFVAMAIFSKDQPFVLLPLNTGDKSFSLESDREIMISYNSRDNYKSFRIATTSLDYPWEDLESEFVAPTIPLDEGLLQPGDEDRKMKTAWITLTNSGDVALFTRAVEHEWST